MDGFRSLSAVGTRGRARRTSARRAVPFMVLSGVVHAAALGAALVASAPSRPDAPASRVVLVDLAPASPASETGALLPVDRPAEDADTPATLSRRVTELSADNAELSAAILEQQQRTAQLEAQYRQEIAALATAQSQLGDELAAVAADREALSTELAAAREQAAALEQELAARRQAEQAALEEVTATYERLVSALQGEIAAKDVALERANARVTVAIVDRVLFPSGQAALTPAGERVIDKVAAALAAAADRRVLVEGHTDDVPIGPDLRQRFPSNWELSTARATEVVKRLIAQARIAPERLQPAGRADTDPVMSNDTEEGRRRNRRIEIILLPPALSKGDTGS